MNYYSVVKAWAVVDSRGSILITNEKRICVFTDYNIAVSVKNDFVSNGKEVSLIEGYVVVTDENQHHKDSKLVYETEEEANDFLDSI